MRTKNLLDFARKKLDLPQTQSGNHHDPLALTITSGIRISGASLELATVDFNRSTSRESLYASELSKESSLVLPTFTTLCGTIALELKSLRQYRTTRTRWQQGATLVLPVLPPLSGVSQCVFPHVHLLPSLLGKLRRLVRL